jgi:hypothetical protein
VTTPDKNPVAPYPAPHRGQRSGASHVLLAQETLKNVNGMTAPNSPVGYGLVETLRELSGAARAVRILADLLERNPNAILFGRNEVQAQ